LATVLRVLRRSHDHRASGVVLISGDPGIGKTALLSEIARQAAHIHIRVARSKCDEVGQAYLGAPILGLLRAGRDPLIAAADFEALTELTGNPLVLVDRAAGHLQTVAATQPVLIVVDDVHWADPVSRYALRSLIPRLAGWPVVWVLASRSHTDGVSVSAADMVEVEHISLGPLPRSAITDIARDRLGHKVSDDEQELLDAAGGNPFLATQIVEGLARRAESDRDGVPAEFHAAMRYRLSGLRVFRASLSMPSPWPAARSASRNCLECATSLPAPTTTTPSTPRLPRVWSPPLAPNWHSSMTWSGSPSTTRSPPTCGGGFTPATPNISRPQIQQRPPLTQGWRSPSVTRPTPRS